MRVVVYKNLTRGCWSIAEAIGRTGLRRGKVIEHRASVALSGVVFVVEEAGRLRVMRKGTREVHAWAVGAIVDGVPAGLTGEDVTYSPWRAGTFQTRGGDAVRGGRFVEFTRSHGAIGFDLERLR
jgi:hypothetical protein